MFVIRDKKGNTFTSCEVDENFDKEVQYRTRKEATEALRQLELNLPKGLFHVEELEELFKCERCDGSEDVTTVYINDEPKTYCRSCRLEMFTKKNPVGRPSVGITKKISLTLPELEWDWFDKQADGNRSQFVRRLVWEAQSEENEWSNYACLGYAISGATKLGYDEEQIHNLVRAIYGEFDWKSVGQAEKVYTKSSY